MEFEKFKKITGLILSWILILGVLVGFMSYINDLRIDNKINSINPKFEQIDTRFDAVLEAINNEFSTKEDINLMNGHLKDILERNYTDIKEAKNLIENLSEKVTANTLNIMGLKK